jgi:hypothetical protein
MTKKIVIISLSCLALAVGGVVWLFVAFYMSMERGEAHRRHMEEERRSGRDAFGEEPALFAVAQAIVKNDQDAIRAAAKAVPDLQAPGRDGTTLLSFAVRETWQRPELVEAARTLLSLGADPNNTNDSRWSFALADAVHGPAGLLRIMLEAGGDPNARDEHGRPIVLTIWDLIYYKRDERARLDLLLDRGADINSMMPKDSWNCAGLTLLLCRTSSGLDDSRAYADALYLLERGADPHLAAGKGTTFAKMLMEHRQQFTAGKRTPPPEFEALWEWAQTHGNLRQPE